MSVSQFPNKPGNGRIQAAIGAGAVTTALGLLSGLGSQPWWLTVSLMAAITILGVVYMITSAWGERPPPAPPAQNNMPLRDVTAMLSAMRENGSEPYSLTRDHAKLKDDDLHAPPTPRRG
jgi:hypothetical protein